MMQLDTYLIVLNNMQFCMCIIPYIKQLNPPYALYVMQMLIPCVDLNNL